MSRAFTKERDDAPEPELVVPRLRREIGEIAPPADRRVVGFGATVVVEGTHPEPHTFTVVTPEEGDIAAGRLAYDSPLAQAMLGARAGERVVWHRPAGDRTIRVRTITYP